MSREPEEQRLVSEIAARMLRKLRLNGHKAHWSEASLDYLLHRLKEEYEELLAACYDNSSTGEEIANEAADVANMAAMVADVTKRRKPSQPFDPTRPEP